MVRQWVQRLQESGILQIVAVTNPKKIGYHTMALIGVKAEGKRLPEIAEEIAAYEEVIGALIQRGVMPDDDSREPWFLCYAHSGQDIAETLTVFEGALTEIQQGHQQAAIWDMAA